MIIANERVEWITLYHDACAYNSTNIHNLIYLYTTYAGTYLRHAPGCGSLKTKIFVVWSRCKCIYVFSTYTNAYAVESYTELINKIEFLVRVLVTQSHCWHTQIHITIGTRVPAQSAYNNIINYRGNRVCKLRAHINRLPFVHGCYNFCFFFFH